MPVIRVNGLNKLTELKRLQEMRTTICQAVVGVKELGISSWDDIETNFPSEINTSATRGEIIIEVIELWKKPERTKKVQDKLAVALVEAVQLVLGRFVDICCIVHPLFDTKKQGFAMKRIPKKK